MLRKIPAATHLGDKLIVLGKALKKLGGGGSPFDAL